MRVLQPALVPLAFADEDTVIATATTPSGTSLVRVSLSGGSPVAIALQPPPLDPAGVTVDPVTHLLGYVARDARGVTQAYLASFTGGAARQLTSFSPRDRAAVSVTFEVPPAG
jgi:hypothetical protein